MSDQARHGERTLRVTKLRDSYFCNPGIWKVGPTVISSHLSNLNPFDLQKVLFQIYCQLMLIIVFKFVLAKENSGLNHVTIFFLTCLLLGWP